jgi:hypothetical protein
LKQNSALHFFDKVNISASKFNKKKNQLESEAAKMDAILKNPKHQNLVKFSSGKQSASVGFEGPE